MESSNLLRNQRGLKTRKIYPGKCTQCGRKVEAKDNELALCPYCGGKTKEIVSR